METHADLNFYYAIHRAQLEALARYTSAVSAITEDERKPRGKALARWVKGFVLELEEHHYVEDAFFFPSLRAKVPAATSVLDGLDADHRHLDELLARWRRVSAQLTDPTVPFADARNNAVVFARVLSEFLECHLAIEDRDVLPLFERHYDAAEYEAVVQQAIKKGKKAGMWFVAPFTVDCYPEGPERDAFLASVPGVLRLLHRLVRPSYDRLLLAALGPAAVPVDVSSARAA